MKPIALIVLTLFMAGCKTVDSHVNPYIEETLATKGAVIAHKWHIPELDVDSDDNSVSYGNEDGRPIRVTKVPESFNFLLDLGDVALPLEVSKQEYDRFNIGDEVEIEVGQKLYAKELHR